MNIERINAADPDALTIALWLILFCAFMCAIAWMCNRQKRKRNRWIDDPRPYARSSIEYSKPHMPERR